MGHFIWRQAPVAPALRAARAAVFFSNPPEIAEFCAAADIFRLKITTVIPLV
jgi:hypothetical protein